MVLVLMQASCQFCRGSLWWAIIRRYDFIRDAGRRVKTTLLVAQVLSPGERPGRTCPHPGGDWPAHNVADGVFARLSLPRMPANARLPHADWTCRAPEECTELRRGFSKWGFSGLS